MDNAIKEFKGDNAFLSNLDVAPVIYEGIRFENSEAAFQAAKCPERMREFCGLSPQAAKRLGRRVEMRPDWETVKYDVMYQVCMAKFTQNPDLLEKLLATGDAELVEGNTWGDKVWGVCDGIGENNLGKTLMRIRSEQKMSSLNGKRVRVVDNGKIRYGIIISSLTKEETDKCSMFGQLIKAKMDDTEQDEEFTYGWSIV